MDYENMPPSNFPKCCDCGCTCSTMNRSFSGTLIRSVKRKFDENITIPGFVLTHNARIEVDNECAALREMVSSQQETIQELCEELEEERNAASSAANEAMSMMVRLQREKAEIQMEFKQFKRFVEEKMAHDSQEMLAFEDLLFKRDQTIQSLSCEVQMYKHRMMSYGLTEAEADGNADGEKEKERGVFSRNNSYNTEGQFDVPVYDYPPLKCNVSETQGYPEADSEASDIEKFAFGETPKFRSNLRDLDHRINHLERSPTYDQPNNDLEKVIVGQSPRHPRHLRKFSTDSSSSFFKDTCQDTVTDSPKFGERNRKAREYSNLREVDNRSGDDDDMSDRVYTIDSVHDEPKVSTGMSEEYMNTPRESYHTDMEDPDMKKLYARLQALEADRESMRQAMISMRTDKAQLVLLKEIAQQLSEKMVPARRPSMKKTSLVRNSSMSVFKWIMSFVFWKKKARRCKYMCGMSANNMGLRMLLEKGQRMGQWRRLSSTQV